MKIKKIQVWLNAKSTKKYTGEENKIFAFFISSAPRPHLVCSLIYRGALLFKLMKDSYYFPHDSNAKHDPKLSALIKNFGWEGYGLWWGIIEIMHEQGGSFEKFPKLYEGLSHSLSTNEALLKQIISASINDFHLLKEDEKLIWSDRVIRNIQNRIEKRMEKVEAGRLGGIKSGIKRRKMKQNEAMLEANEPKESKVNKIKEEKNIVKKFTHLENESFNKTFNDYLEMRLKMKKGAATERAKELALIELHKYPIDTAIKMIEASILNGWTGIFPLRQNQNDSFNKPDKVIDAYMKGTNV